MKRVQAIVSGGKKKQCTKLPSPSQPSPAQPSSKGKTSSTSSKDLPAGNINNNNNSKKKGKGKTPLPTPSDKRVAAAVVAGGSGKDGDANDATSASSPIPSPSAASTDDTTIPKTTPTETTTAQAASTTTTTTTTTTTAATKSSSAATGGNRSPGSRTPSRIPASSPKKTRDATGTPSGKGRLRLESEEKPKKKPSLIRKLSLKDKQKSDRKKSKSDPPSDRSEPGGSSTGYVSSGEETKSKTGDDTRSRTASRSEGEVESQVSVSTRSSNDSRTITPQPSQSQFSDSASQRRGSDSTLGKEDADEKLGEPQAAKTEKDCQAVSNPGDANGQQKLKGPTPLTAGYTNGHGANAQQQHHYANVRRTQSTNVPMPRDGSRPQVQGQRQAVPRGHPRANGEAMMHRHAYASLPRSSRATTPTGEDVYSYGTLPRRSNSNTPTPQTVAYHNNIYGTVGGASSWGTLSREGSSDSGFNMPPNNERGRPARPINGNYYANGYPHDYRRLPRAGSVPPAVADGPESIYSLARADSVPPVYYSDGEYGRYPQPPRGVRAGSVPLGYESESSAYVDGSRGVARNYESDSGNDERSSGLRAASEDEFYRAGPGKRPIPRRHTLGAPNKGRRGDSVSYDFYCPLLTL